MNSILRAVWHAVRHLPLLLALSVLMPHIMLLHLVAALCGGEGEAREVPQ